MKTLIILTLCLLAAAACGDDDDEPTPAPTGSPAVGSTRTVTPAASAAADVTPEGGGTPYPTRASVPIVCTENPDPVTADILLVDSPVAGATVTSPITVSGQIAAFEAQFQITLYDASGGVVADMAGHSQEGQVLSPFSEQLMFPSNASGPACLWVYEHSAQDGQPIHVKQVPIVLAP